MTHFSKGMSLFQIAGSTRSLCSFCSLHKSTRSPFFLSLLGSWHRPYREICRSLELEKFECGVGDVFGAEGRQPEGSAA